MTSKQKIFSILSLTLLAFVACGKHPINKPTPTPTPTPDPAPVVPQSITAAPLVIGGESATGSKIGSKVFKGVVAALSKTGATQDDVIDSILTNINSKFSSDFSNQNFLVTVATIDAGKATATLSNLNIFDGKDGVQTSAFVLSKKDKKYTAAQIVDASKKSAATLKIAGQDVMLDNSDATKTSKAKVATIPAKGGAYAIEASINGTAITWNLPVFKIADENKMIPDPITLDISKKDSGYADPIAIEQKFFEDDKESVECVMIHAADSKIKGDSTAIFTNFVDFKNNQITFKSFEDTSLSGFSKLYPSKNIPVNLVCFAMDIQEGKNINVFAISQVKTNIFIGASESKPAAVESDVTTTEVNPDATGTITVSGKCVTGQKVKVIGDDVDADVPEVDCKDAKYSIPNVKIKATALMKTTAPVVNVKSKDAKGADITVPVKVTIKKATQTLTVTKVDKTANNIVTISGDCTPGSTITLSGTDISGTPPTQSCATDAADATKGTYKIDGVTLNTVADGVNQTVKVTSTKDSKSEDATAQVPKAVLPSPNPKPASPMIDSPIDGAALTSSTATIQGKCAIQNDDIKIAGTNLNKESAGICDDKLTFSIQISIKKFPVKISVTESDATTKAVSDPTIMTLNKKTTTTKKKTTGSKKK